VVAVAMNLPLAVVGIAAGGVIMLFICPALAGAARLGYPLRRANIKVSVNGHKSEVPTEWPGPPLTNTSPGARPGFFSSAEQFPLAEHDCHLIDQAGRGNPAGFHR
jgi:hypothetical protein